MRRAGPKGLVAERRVLSALRGWGPAAPSAQAAPARCGGRGHGPGEDTPGRFDQTIVWFGQDRVAPGLVGEGEGAGRQVSDDSLRFLLEVQVARLGE